MNKEIEMYCVKVLDRAGEFKSVDCATFQAAKSRAAVLHIVYPGKLVQVFNLDLCDGESDGLTGEECEAIDEIA